MNVKDLPIGATDWSQVSASVHPGKSGTATARAPLGEIQLHLVEYSTGYVADHGCSKGHIVFVISGSLVIEHQDGRRYALTPGMSYHIADDDGPPHRALSDRGATIFIVD
jgi:mannose-6-phosphate isomerase class I